VAPETQRRKYSRELWAAAQPANLWRGVDQLRSWIIQTIKHKASHLGNPPPKLMGYAVVRGPGRTTGKTGKGAAASKGSRPWQLLADREETAPALCVLVSNSHPFGSSEVWGNAFSAGSLWTARVREKKSLVFLRGAVRAGRSTLPRAST